MARVTRSLSLLALAAAGALAQTRDCPTANLTPGTTVNSALATTDCQLREMLTITTSTVLAKRYRVEIPEKAVASFSFAGTGFAPVLYMLTAEGRLIANSGTNTVGGTARVTINLPAGTYTLFAAALAANATGSFVLRLDTEAPRPCLVVDLADAVAVEGSFSASSCRFVDINELSTSTANVAFFLYTAPRRGVLTFTADTVIQRFTSVLVTEALDSFSGTTGLLISLEPGQQLISVSSPNAGSFTLSTSFGDLRECPVTPVAMDSQVAGSLTSSSCRWLDVLVPGDDRTPLQLYSLTTDSKTIGQIDMTSLSVDTYLALVSPRTLALIASNDDATANTSDASILVNLPPSTYVIFASAYDETTLGDYSLKLAGSAPRTCNEPGLTPGAASDGQVPATGCRVLDYVNLSTVSDLVAPFRFDAANATMLGFRMEAAPSSAVRLVSSDGAQRLGFATSAAGALASETRVPGDRYRFLVTSSATVKPNFKLTVIPREVPTCAAVPLPVNGEAEGTISTVECKYHEQMNFVTAQANALAFSLTVPERGRVVVEAESSVFAPVLAWVSSEDVLLGINVGTAAGRVSISNPLAEPGVVKLVTAAASAPGVGAIKVRNTFTPAAVTADPLPSAPSAEMHRLLESTVTERESAPATSVRPLRIGKPEKHRFKTGGGL